MDPLKNLANSINTMAVRAASTAVTGVPCELGTITATMGLKLDRFRHEIQDYLVSEHLVLAKPDFTDTETDGAHSQPDAGYGGAHAHKVITPSELRPLGSGDRVLAAPVNGGQEYIVVARVVPYA